PGPAVRPGGPHGGAGRGAGGETAVSAPTRAVDLASPDRARPSETTPDHDLGDGTLPHDCLPESLDAVDDPSPPRGRLTGVDAARGLALLGMFAVHIFPAGTA